MVEGDYAIEEDDVEPFYMRERKVQDEGLDPHASGKVGRHCGIPACHDRSSVLGIPTEW